MDDRFRSWLVQKGVKEGSMAVLEGEDVTTSKIFEQLKENHILRLLKHDKVTVGQHSLLWQLWEEMTAGQLQGQKELKPSTSVKLARPLMNRPLASSHSGSSTPPSSDCETRKELFESYKARMKNEAKGKGHRVQMKATKPAGKKHIAIHLGAMLYNPDLQRGVRKKFLPPPLLIDFPRSATYEDVLSRGREVFFSEMDEDDYDDISNYRLCSTGGVPFYVEDVNTWTLDRFLDEHGFQPSKLRLYIMYTEQKEAEDGTGKRESSSTSDPDDTVKGNKITKTTPAVKEGCPSEAEDDTVKRESSSPSDPDDTVKGSRIRKTTLAVKECRTCRRQFKAPIEGTFCQLPDGGGMFYNDPVLDCPICDELGFGESWNKDFMPDL